jgi:hypothetical protein
MNALYIQIENAKIFPNHRYSKDYVYDARSQALPRSKHGKALEPYYNIPVNRLIVPHVANLLRVLCGQRPVPSLRKTKLTGDPFYDDLAQKCRTIMNNPIDKFGEYYKEVLKSNKSHYQSWKNTTIDYYLDNRYFPVKGGMIYWARLKRILDEDLFNQFVNLTNELLNRDDCISSISAQEAIELLNKNKTESIVINFCNSLVQSKQTSLSNIILNTPTTKNGVTTYASNSITFHTQIKKLNALMVSSYPDKIQKINATIIVPIDDTTLNLIQNGPGTATFLDGGLAYLNGLEEWSPILELSSEPIEKGIIICS